MTKTPILSCFRLKDFVPVNLAKVGILNLLAVRNLWKYRKELSGYEKKLFMGVFLSGRMHAENVRPLLQDACAWANQRGWELELLAHPGGIYEPEDIAQLTNRDAPGAALDRPVFSLYR